MSGIEQNLELKRTESPDLVTALAAAILGVYLCYSYGFDITWIYYLTLSCVAVVSFLILQSKQVNKYLRIPVLFAAVVALSVMTCISTSKLYGLMLPWASYLPLIVAIICYLILDAKLWEKFLPFETSTTGTTPTTESEYGDENDWSPNNMEIFQHPMCLISSINETNEWNEEGTTTNLKIEEGTIEQIKQIRWPMVVIAIVGVYRTGKSHLMNRLARATKGFALSDGIESKTRGIWSWCIILPERPKTVLLLLDTEGLGNVNKGETSHDNKMSTLATLLCNCLVYNIKGAFDSDAIAKLTFVMEMADNIRFREERSDDNQYLNVIQPDFVLCARDFSLKLVKDGKKITEQEYLEMSLAENTSKSEQFNKLRACIRKNFPKRDCFLFPVPGDWYVLDNLDSLRLDDLSDKFKKATSKFVSFIYKKPPKVLASEPVNGQMFAILVEQYVTKIKHEAVQYVDDAFTAVSRAENTKLENEAIVQFENQTKKLTPLIHQKDLVRSYTNAQESTVIYQRRDVNDKNAQHEQKTEITGSHGCVQGRKETAKNMIEVDESLAQKQKEDKERHKKEHLDNPYKKLEEDRKKQEKIDEEKKEHDKLKRKEIERRERNGISG